MFLYAYLKYEKYRLLAISPEISCFYEPRELWLGFVVGKLVIFICSSSLGISKMILRQRSQLSVQLKNKAKGDAD